MFGEIHGGAMRLNDYGVIVRDEWLKTADIRAEIEMDEYVIMPNHIHGIVWIVNPVGAYGHTPLPDVSNKFVSPSKTVGAMVRGFKSSVTKQINVKRDTPAAPVWQRNYYERIIRDEAMLRHIRGYIATVLICQI
ncbi:MAG: hypothetical protein PHS37_00590 [Candidatus Omnitrophica bacterium]|nr:hypothetical protein [Candidatus Omnitrophota bacterium]